MTPTEVACFLFGCGVGVGLSFVATWLVIGFNDWRRAVREGTPLIGEGIERNKRRGDL